MNAQVKPGYKLTDVGVIPEDWDVVNLGEHANFRTGPFGSALHKSDYTIAGVPVINPMHILDGQITPTSTMTITEQAAQSLAEFRLKFGEVVIGRRGDMGRCAVVQQHQQGWMCGTGSMIVRPGKNFDAEFLQRILSSSKIVAAIEDMSVGSTMINLNQGVLAGLKLQLPPLVEQRHIASALSDMDALINGLDQLITKKRDIKQAAMQQLLTGQQRLPGFSGEWEVRQIGESIDLLSGFPFSSDSYSNSGVRLLRGSNVKRGKTDWSDEITQFWPSINQEISKYEVNVGDLVISMDGSLVGRSYARIIEADLPALLLQRVARIRSRTIDIGFLTQFIGSQFFITHCDSVKTVTAIPHISSDDIRSFSIPCPPTIEEQTAIATILTDMDSELTALETRRDKSLQLKQGMMQELLTGRIRLL